MHNFKSFPIFVDIAIELHSLSKSNHLTSQTLKIRLQISNFKIQKQTCCTVSTIFLWPSSCPFMLISIDYNLFLTVLDISEHGFGTQKTYCTLYKLLVIDQNVSMKREMICFFFFHGRFSLVDLRTKITTKTYLWHLVCQ